MPEFYRKWQRLCILAIFFIEMCNRNFERNAVLTIPYISCAQYDNIIYNIPVSHRPKWHINFNSKSFPSTPDCTLSFIFIKICRWGEVLGFIFLDARCCVALLFALYSWPLFLQVLFSCCELEGSWNEEAKILCPTNLLKPISKKKL